MKRNMIRFVDGVLKGKYYLPIHKRQESYLTNNICEKLLKRKTRFEKNGFAFRKLKLTACIFQGYT